MYFSDVISSRHICIHPATLTPDRGLLMAVCAAKIYYIFGLRNYKTTAEDSTLYNSAVSRLYPRFCVSQEQTWLFKFIFYYILHFRIWSYLCNQLNIQTIWQDL